jgi:hypothetical protein
MGGAGSGPRSWPTGMLTVEETVRLSITQLVRAGLLVGGGPANGQLRLGEGETASVSVSTMPGDDGRHDIQLNYKVESEGAWASVKETVHVTGTRLCSGGERLWFLCPPCGHRVGVLFLPVGQRFFACRRCHGLTYGCRLKGCWDKGSHGRACGGWG